MQISSSFLALALGLTTAVNAASIAQPNRRAADTSFQKPVLGYNTYNAIGCQPTEKFAHEQINTMQKDGYLAAGYDLFSIDCGWQENNIHRNSSAGNAIPQNLTSFPAGMQALGQYAISRGFRYGLYSDAGYRSCLPTAISDEVGSLGYENEDAAQFASWNVSYLKYDNCYASGPTPADSAPLSPRKDFITRYSPMTTALRSRGIMGELVCQWGLGYITNAGYIEGPVAWTGNISTSFRMAGDISDNWGAVNRIINQAIYVANTDMTGPGHHGDGDLLEVGNGGMSFAEEQSHFAFWSMIKSALMMSTDLTKLSSEEQKLLTNSKLIDINQDDLGKPVKLVQRYTNDHDLFAGPLSNGDMAVLAINQMNSTRSLSIDFSDLNITKANVEDLISGYTGSGASSYSANIDGHAPIALRLSNIVKSTKAPPSVDWIDATSGTRSGDANIQVCSACPGGKKVGYIGNGTNNSLTFDNLKVNSANATILFDYLNCDVTVTSSTNMRTGSISVNGGEPVDVSFPISGYNWDASITHNYRVALSGFKPGSSNSINITSTSGYAPDVSRIGIIA
ncbi:glycoside hydrolase [Meira miltonrushii]|uniref:Alpha-galactosidase n=1 Tax=Meira miltonrushii TaxID=1280837 RepID=A0A316V5M5_9BASI|nr:glycoside hydrolase [Meira miltonrushii]PWN31523.1 glycoside hydrolase [Meira miltonrushii]